ncbi:MAG: dihydroorotate dehydrogenase-like protein [Candidatus Sumerlaeia bacterium]|nr:dihydroorotate dehydrogenase-like protein [Candidatus Sumerlaeia bacterium]
MIDLSTTYLGLSLPNPIVVSACPLSEKVDNIRRMEDAGAAAVVLHSLFEEQITRDSDVLDSSFNIGEESYAEALSYFPDLGEYNLGPEGYLDHIAKAKAAVRIPIIASLNGVTNGGWVQYARKIEEAGADALELNIYQIPTDPMISGLGVEERYVELVREVRANTRLPLAVKISPFFSSPGNIIERLSDAGAGAVVMFNRFYQPDIDLEELEVIPSLNLSTSEELRLRLRWVAYLYSRVKADMAITGGVHTTEDVIKSIMVGARVVMLASSLFKNGIDHILTLREGILNWMDERDYESIRQMTGSMSTRWIAEPDVYARSNYMKVIGSYSMRPPGTGPRPPAYKKLPGASQA